MSGLLCLVRYRRVPTPLLYISWSFVFTLSSSFASLLAVNLGAPGVIDSHSFMDLSPNFCSRLLIIDGFLFVHVEFTAQVVCYILLDFDRKLLLNHGCKLLYLFFFPIINMSSTYIMIMHIPRLFPLNNIHGSAGLTVKPKGSFFIVSRNFLQNCLAASHNS